MAGKNDAAAMLERTWAARYYLNNAARGNEDDIKAQELMAFMSIFEGRELSAADAARIVREKKEERRKRVR